MLSTTLASSHVSPTSRTPERDRASSEPARSILTEPALRSSARPSSFPSFALAGAGGGVTLVGSLRELDPVEALSALDERHQPVAVYRLLESASRCSAHRFIQDAAALARLTRDAPHPGVLRVHAVGADRRSFLAEHLDGPTLADVQLLGLHLDEKLHVLRRLGEALVAAHAQALFFGRLRPASVVLRAPLGRGPGQRPLEPVIAELPASADCVHEVGSRYAAPEVRRGGSSGARGDVYAFGRLMQFLLTEKHPLDTDEQLPALDDMRGLPAGLVRIARRCLSTNAATRYRDVVSLAADLAQYQSADHVGIRHPAGKEIRVTRSVVALAPRPVAPARDETKRSDKARAPRVARTSMVVAPAIAADGLWRATAASVVAVLAIGLVSLTGPDAARRMVGAVAPRTQAARLR